MNFDLEDRLIPLLRQNELDKAISLAEEELKKIPATDFHQVLGVSLLNLKQDLKLFIEKFQSSSIRVLNAKQPIFKRLFSKKTLMPEAFYTEVNGFTINYDRWFLDMFSYEKIGSQENWDWLADFYGSSDKDFTITGLEHLQKVYEHVHENQLFDDPNIESAYEVCELLIILRLQELFKETWKDMDNEWSIIPMFVTAHDYELIYKVN